MEMTPEGQQGESGDALATEEMSDVIAASANSKCAPSGDPSGNGHSPVLSLNAVGLPKAVKSLDELQIVPKVRQAHRVKEYFKYTVCSTQHPDGSLGQYRRLLRYPKLVNEQWLYSEWGEDENLTRPAGLNLYKVNAYCLHYGSAKPVVWIVSDETACMIMEQNGSLAVCSFEESDENSVSEENGASEESGQSAITNATITEQEALAQALQGFGIQEVRIVFANDVAGRTRAVKMAEACQQTGIRAVVHSFIAKRGHDIRDEWEAQKFDREKFCSRMKTLPLVDDATLLEWKTNPEVGLELAESNAMVPYNLTTVDELRQEPPQPYLVDKLIPRRSVAMLSGRHSCGKSAKALDIALCVATGRDWHGHAVEKGPVLYIFAEGGAGAAPRIHAWQTVHEVENDSVKDFYVLKQPVAIHDSAVQSRLLASFREKKLGGIALIIVDTLARCCGGLEENSARDMGRFLAALEKISQATGAAILVVHHDSKKGEYRGSSALAAGVDTHLGVIAENGAARVVLEVLKQKDDEPIRPLAFQRRVVNLQDKDGLPLSSFVYELDTAPRGLLQQLSSSEKIVAQALMDITSENVYGGAGTAEGDTLAENGATSSQWEKACREGKEISESTFDRAKRQLISLEAVACQNPGQRGALYVVQPEWRRLLSSEAFDSYLTTFTSDMSSDEQGSSDELDEAGNDLDEAGFPKPPSPDAPSAPSLGASSSLEIVKLAA